MNKDEKTQRRVFGRQVAVELPENDLESVDGGRHALHKWTTCSGGDITHNPRTTSRDCTGTPDDYAF